MYMRKVNLSGSTTMTLLTAFHITDSLVGLQHSEFVFLDYKNPA